MATQFITALNRTYQEMRESSDSTTYPIALTKKKINELLSHIYRWEVVSILDPEVKYVAWRLRFTEKNAYIESNGTSLTTTIHEVWDTEMNCDTSKLAIASPWSPKHIVIMGQVIQYTWQSATQITGVTGIASSIKSWAMIRQVHKLPDGCNKPEGLRWQVNEANPAKVPFFDSRGEMDVTAYFTILNDDSTTAQYIQIMGYDDSNYPFKLTYYKKFTYLVNDSDECELPEDFMETVCSNIVAWEWLYTTEQVEAGTILLMKWYAALQQLFSEYASPVKHYRQTVKVKPMEWIWSVGTKKVIYIRQ